MTHTLSPAGGSTVVASMVITPLQFQLSATGSGGVAVGFDLERHDMNGTASLDGEDVAMVTFADNCAYIDYFAELLQDGTYCAG